MNNERFYFPQVWLDKFFRGFFSPERPDFHPERYLGLHILEVTVKAVETGNVNLIFAALLHDICKPDSGKMVSKENFSYWSNPYHDMEAHDFILGNKEIQDWIVAFGGDVSVVTDICKYHMREKNYKVMRPIKQEKYLAQTAHIREELEKFSQIDRMVS